MNKEKMTRPRGDIDEIRQAVKNLLMEHYGNGKFILLYCQPETDGETTMLVATVPRDFVVVTLLDTADLLQDGSEDFCQDEFEVKH